MFIYFMFTEALILKAQDVKALYISLKNSLFTAHSFRFIKQRSIAGIESEAQQETEIKEIRKM